MLLRFALFLTLLAGAGLAEQLIWLFPRSTLSPAAPFGSVDVLDLFYPGAPWEKAASRTHVFGMFASTPQFMSDADLRRIIEDLKRRNIALGIHPRPLSSEGCGKETDGFGARNMFIALHLIKAAGGEVKYILMDYPFAGGSLDPTTCRWTPEQTAVATARNIAAVKRLFPGVKIGDIEPCPNLSGGVDNTVNNYKHWFDAYAGASGTELDFFACDTRLTDEWWPINRKLQRAARDRGIPFAACYNGSSLDASDAMWIQRSRSYYTDSELHIGPPPAHAIFMSWQPHPTHVLPESDPLTFTNLLNSYFRDRTRAELTVSQGQARGRLTDSKGNPVGSAPISVGAIAISGRGVASTAIVRGDVPPEFSGVYINPPNNADLNTPAEPIAAAQLLICINRCNSSHAGDLDIYSFEYTDAGLKEPVVRDFKNGLTDWTIVRSGAIQLTVESLAEAKLLHVVTTKEQSASLLSRPFALTPGKSFELRLRARVSPDSLESGSYALIYLNAAGKELFRHQYPFRPIPVPVQTVTSSADGSFSASLSSVASLASPGFAIETRYDGNTDRWPAYASYPFFTTPSIDKDGVVSGASFDPIPVAPGSWVTVFGSNLGTAASWSGASAASLGGASVSVCGAAATLSYNSGPVVSLDRTRWQLNALVPDAVTGKTTCPVTITVNGQTSEAGTLAIAPGVIELFSYTIPAGRFPVVTHADYSVVGPASAGLVPAQPGETLIAWGTGNCANPSMTVGDQSANVTYAGRVAPGLCQINFKVPAAARAPAELQVGGAPESYRLALPPAPLVPLDENREWRFADVTAGLAGWYGVSVEQSAMGGYMGPASLRIEEGVLVVQGTSQPGYLESPWFYAGPAGLSKLLVRMETTQDTRASFGFWIVGESRFDTKDTIGFDVKGGGMRDYVIPIPSPARFAGKTIQLRFQPSRLTEWKVRIESVRVE